MRLLPALLTLLALGTLSARATAQQSPHGKLPEGVDCADCHTPESWKPDPATVKFDHGRQARFPLEGRHRDVSCRSCHLDLTFADPVLRGAECATCHADVHRGAYAQRCVECHTPVSFSDMSVRQIHARTTFPLTGAHLQIACRACHVDSQLGTFAPLDPQCLSCHQAAYEGAQPVNHATFSTDCLRCHNTIAWTAYVRFDHPEVAGGFRLLGVHARISCESCHSPTDWSVPFGASGDEDCISCHADDYAGEHAGSAFPTTCLACHTTESWEGADFPDHDPLYFPVYSGEHRGKWDACQDCHVQPGSFQVFSCLTCHEHDQTRMDDKHREESGYTYDSNACYQCHPDGRAED
jgi:hypothetical protein